MKLAPLGAFCATVSCSAFGDDVTFNWQKLIDMQTDVSLQAENFAFKKADLSGHVQFDLFRKKLKIVVSGSVEAKASPHNPLFPPGSEKNGTSELVLDALAGTIGIRTQGTASGPVSGAANYCLVVKAAPQFFFPLTVVEMRLESIGQSLERMANRAPHTVKDGVVTYLAEPNGPYKARYHWPIDKNLVEIHTDGVPIKYATHEVCDETCLEQAGRQGNNPYRNGNNPSSMEVSFSNWQAGAGDVEVFSCSTGSTTDLSAYPHAMHAVTAYDLLIQHLLEHPETRDLAKQLPSTVPLVEEQIRLASTQQKTPSMWSSLVVSLAAGMSGGAVVLALVAAFARKTWKIEPLLSEA